MYGVLVILPLFFLEEKLNADYPPPITHPEYFYGFAGIVLLCQFVFLAVAVNPLRMRQFMLFGVFEKLSLLPAFFILNPQGRFPALWIPGLIIDLVLGILFFVAYLRTKPAVATV